MATPNNQRITIMIAGAALALIVVVIIFWYLLSGSPATPTPTASPAPGDTTAGFKLDVLQRNGYKALDQTPVQSGDLPVKPPANIGKANPFL